MSKSKPSAAAYAKAYAKLGELFTAAPGISGVRFRGGMRVWGTQADLIKARLADDETFFAVLPKRTLYIDDGSRSVHSYRRAGGIFELFILQGRGVLPPRYGSYDGNAAVAWTDCAWRPSGHDVSTPAVPQPQLVVGIEKLKRTLRLVGITCEAPEFQQLAEDALAVIVHLETQKHEALLWIDRTGDQERLRSLLKLLGRCREVPVRRDAGAGHA